MHQHPRPPPATASSANSSRANPARTSNPRDRGAESNTSQAEVGLRNTTTGLGIEHEAEIFVQVPSNVAPGREIIAKLNQIVQQYHTKAALIILHSRVELPPAYNKDSDIKRVNRWFNVELEETDVLRDDLRTWKSCDTTDRRPPPMIIETYLDPDELTHNQSLVILDDHGKRWDVLEALDASFNYKGSQDTRYSRVILERWKVELGDASSDLPADLGSILPTLYKKSIVLFRSLYTYSRFLPAWKFSKRQSTMRSNPSLPIRYRIYKGSRPETHQGLDPLSVPFYDDAGKSTDTFIFGVTESPAGPFSVQVTYRLNCDFRVDDSEALLSSRFMGADDTYFRPSLPTEDHFPGGTHEAGSLPVARRENDRPNNAQAYGSLSTFHHDVPATGVSPLSALRAAREHGAGLSGSPISPPSPKPGQARPGIHPRDGVHSAQRKPSISFPPFKAPPLSASPSLVDPAVGSPRSATVRTGPVNVPSDSKTMPPPTSAASVTRKSTYISSDNAIASSGSGSPRPAPISKYTSSFTHRRGRLSSGGISKADDDNTSSGRASATSSTAQPSSGIIAEPGGTSSSSLHRDESNIGEFLKMLDMRKDLLSPSDPATMDASTRRTAVALTRFQKMKESNAVLSDSMSSSLVLHRSSTSSSRQLPSVPPMIAGTSISTASSPGKPISPHTPHTPAIPSRLSSNSIIDYSHQDRPDNRRHRLSHESHGSLLEEAAAEETTTEPTAPNSNANAIDIPTSPRPFIPSYRRSSSAAQRRSSVALEDETGDFLPFGMRSLSLGAEDRSPLSLSALVRQQELDNDAAAPDALQTAQRVCDDSNNSDDVSTPAKYRAPSTTSNHPYQPRFSHQRGRGSTGHAHSQSSASSSLGRGNALPSYNRAECDRDAYQGSGSNSGMSTNTDSRRGLGSGGGSTQRFSFTRYHGPPSASNFEEDEPLLFTMSDFGIARGSLDGGGRGSISGADSSGPGTGISGSRRGSGRRGPSSGSGFHAWQ